MLKRVFDICISLIGLIVLLPLLVLTLLAVWVQDGRSPFYTPNRVGKNGRLFTMVKIRSMIVGADKSKVDSTGSDDRRITPIGHFIRRAKLDEMIQLVNVLTGSMSLVGPRPNVVREVSIYTDEEQKLLSVKPGITDPASIVFSDIGDILAGHDDANLAYNQLVRPWKSRLSIFYLQRASVANDLQVLFCTFLLIVSREKSLKILSKLMFKMGAENELVCLVTRREPLHPTPPPGSCEIVTTRDFLKNEISF